MQSRRVKAVAMVVVCIALLALVGCSDDGDDDAAPEPQRSTRGADVSVPTVTGPIEGGAYDLPFTPAPRELLADADYTEEEYFLRGTATSYAPDGTWGEDGAWAVTDGETAEYATRILVRRPADPDAFDGTVAVEWFNVTSGMDADPDWGFLHPELTRSGTAWVGVSAQFTGVEGSDAVIDIPGLDLIALKQWDPERYGELVHPGDEYSYDMFSQAAQALLRPDGVDPLGGLEPERLVAVGESQSAARLVTYANAVQPVADIYDGFLIHSRGGGGAPIDDTTEMPNPALVRTDLADPVMIFQTETDLFGLGSHAARQPDTDTIVTWEVAGSAHADVDTLDYGVEAAQQWSDDEPPDFAEMCGGPLNDGGQQFPLRQAFSSLVEWVRGSDAPATGELIEVVAGTEEIARDEVGNALGGVRTTLVDVPIATYDGEPRPDSSIICSLFGSTTPFSDEELAALYPSHDDYVDEVRDAADLLVDGRFLLGDDREILVAEAEAADVS